jgi:thymidine phosphorylase
MDQPLASCAGNALEIRYSIDYLKNVSCESRFHGVVMALGTKMLVLGKLASDETEARKKLEQALSSGRAAEIFSKMVFAMGGPCDVLTNQQMMPLAPVIKPVFSDHEGYVRRIDTRVLGLAIVSLGGGRKQVEDMINPCVGLDQLRALGQKIDRTIALGYVHASDEARFEEAALSLKTAYHIE